MCVCVLNILGIYYYKTGEKKNYNSSECNTK